MTLFKTLKAMGDKLPRIDRETVFPDKRFVPPVRPQGPRIAGTLHLSDRKAIVA